jgi:hypothetical protein
MSKNPSLADVRARRAEIAAEIAKLVGPLQAEDQELASVENVLVRRFDVGEAESNSPPTAASPAAPEADADGPGVGDLVKGAIKGNETIEELIVLLMEHCSDPWWTAAEIQDHLTQVKGKEVPMSSVSPTLTNMKVKGLLVRNGMNVALASEVKNNEAAAE